MSITQRRHVLVVGEDSEPSSRVSAPELDVDAVVAHMSGVMKTWTRYITVSIGCGCAAHETAVLERLVTMGHTFESEVFMDRSITSSTIANVQRYASETKNPKRPIIVFSFADLQMELEHLSTAQIFPEGAQVFIFGIHAAQRFSSMEELEAFHGFLCTCIAMSNAGQMHGEYTNYIHESGISPTDKHTTTPCTQGSHTHALCRRWCDMASQVECQLGAWRERELIQAPVQK